MNKRHRWTNDEVAELKEAYLKPQPDLVVLSNKLKRFPSNICRKARKLGLGTSYHRLKSDAAKANMRKAAGGLTDQEEIWLKENFNNYTEREMAKFLGRSRGTIEYEKAKLGLKTNYKERRWEWRNGHPKGMAGKTHSQEERIAMGIRAKARWADPKSKLNSEEHRQKLSDRAAYLQKTKLFRTRYSRGRMGKRADLDGLFVRSSWEANYARYLNWMKGRGEIQGWSYESQTFDFPVKRGTRFYTPDFRVIENDGSIVFHEVKGWMTQKGQTALNRMAKYYPNIKLILIAKKEYRAISKWKALIPGWESAIPNCWLDLEAKQAVDAKNPRTEVEII